MDAKCAFCWKPLKRGEHRICRRCAALSQRRISPDRFTPGYYLHCMPMRRVAA